MAVAATYTIYSGKIGATVFPITSCQVNPNLAEIIQGGDGSPDPSFAAAMGAAPVISITTPAVATMLGSVAGIDGGKISAATTSTLTLGFQTIVEGGARNVGATTNKLLTINEGMMIPRSLSVSQGGGAAQISYDIYATYDGTNEPIAVTSAALTHTYPSVVLYGMGPVYLDTTAIDGVQSWSLDLGCREIVHADSGETYPRWVGIDTRSPSATVSCVDLAQILPANLGILGKAVTTSVKMFLRKRTEGGTYVADNTSEHIIITLAECRASVQSYGGSHGAVVYPSLKLTPTKGANAIVQIATNSAIS